MSSQKFIEPGHHTLGKSYPDSPQKIHEMVLEHFSRAGVSLPQREEVAQGPHLPGILVPHLDFRVGGHLYPYGFSELLKSAPPEIVVVLGVAHQGTADVAVSRRGVRTLLGESAHATELYDALKAQCAEEIFLESEDVFDDEHSIEFPLVYLHCLGQMYPEYSNINVLPVACGGMHVELEEESASGSAYEEFGLALARAISWSKKKIMLIVSVDGAHVGPRFGAEEPVTEKQMLEVRSADKDALSVASMGIAEVFFETFVPSLNERNFDGIGAIFIALKALERKARFELKKYDQWFWPPDQSMVSIAAGVFCGLSE